MSIKKVCDDDLVYLENTSKGQHQATSNAYKENCRNVEQEGEEGIGQQNGRADACKFVEWSKAFGKWKDCQVDDSAYGCIVMERDKRVHLEAVEKHLDHDETRRLELKDSLSKQALIMVNQLTATAAACVRNPIMLK